MKKPLFLLVMMLLPLAASAHDIEVKNADGVTIYYNYINEGSELEVTSGNSSIYQDEVVIPEEVTYMNRTLKVTSIGQSAFEACTALTSVTIGNNVTSIGIYAFFRCSSLTSVTIGNSVKIIDDKAFSNCKGLTSITIPNSVTTIGYATFSGCTGLTSITIPNSVTSIGKNPFMGCTDLTTMVVDSENTKYDSRENCNAVIESESKTLVSGCKNSSIPNSVTSIGSSAFSGCSDLPSITIPNGVTKIGGSAFNGCSNLISITIPYSVTTIGSNAFRDCSGLTSVTIDSNVTSIGNLVFEGANISTIISLIENPSAIKGKTSDERTFSLNTFSNGTLYVPKGSIDKYMATEGWKDFTNIVESDLGEDDFVDLGLPSGLLWATCNLGASSPEEVGNYYAWGETSPKTFFSQDNYQYKDNPITLDDISGTVYDAATVVLGDSWRMPTKLEFEELAKYCSPKETTLNATICMELTGPNGNKLIIARGGLGEQGTEHEDGYGLWSSTKNITNIERFINTAYRAWEWTYISFSWMWQGIPIRPVKSNASNGILNFDVYKVVTDTSVYNLNGSRLDKPQRGLNIVHMSDGTTKKVVVK